VDISQELLEWVEKDLVGKEKDKIAEIFKTVIN
jgi:hypothetical protein